MTAVDISKEEGVKDLPVGVRLQFARTLLAERMGDPLEAVLYLDKALEAEARYRESVGIK